MKKILFAIDASRGSFDLLDKTVGALRQLQPADVVLIHVERLEGETVMDELILSDSELKTLIESMEGTEHQEMLDRKAAKVVAYFTERLEQQGVTTEKTLIRKGHPAEEILKAIEEIQADLVVMGSQGSRVNRLFLGSVSREVANNATVPVLLMR